MMKIDEVDRLFYVFWGEEHGKPSNSWMPQHSKIRKDLPLNYLT